MDRDPLHVVGWGPFRLPGERKRMAALRARLDGQKPDHGQCLANLAGLVAETLVDRDGLDFDTAYLASVSVANTLNANPQVLRDLLDSLDES